MTTPEQLFAIPVPATQDETVSLNGVKSFDPDSALKAIARGYGCQGNFVSMGPQLQARKDYAHRVCYDHVQAARFALADWRCIYYGIMTGSIDEGPMAGDQDAFRFQTFDEFLSEQKKVGGGTGGPGVVR